MTEPDRVLLHGTVVAIGNCGVLLRGKPGSGKSSLALRLLDQPGYGIGEHLLRARLVADDQVLISRSLGHLTAAPPLALAGKLEIRGFGIVELPHQESCTLRLVVDLVPASQIQRLPEPAEMTCTVLGLALPRLQLDPADSAGPARLRSAMVALNLGQ